MSFSEAHNYLEKFDMRTLYNYLLSQIIYKRPEDPRDFLAQILSQIADNSLRFYSEEEVRLIFHKFEVLERQFITAEQAQKAFADMGFDGVVFSGEVREAQFVQRFTEVQQQRLKDWNEGRQ